MTITNFVETIVCHAGSHASRRVRHLLICTCQCKCLCCSRCIVYITPKIICFYHKYFQILKANYPEEFKVYLWKQNYWSICCRALRNPCQQGKSSSIPVFSEGSRSYWARWQGREPTHILPTPSCTTTQCSRPRSEHFLFDAQMSFVVLFWSTNLLVPCKRVRLYGFGIQVK